MIITIVFLAALIVGIAGIVVARGRDWASWGVVLISAGLLYSRLQ